MWEVIGKGSEPVPYEQDYFPVGLMRLLFAIRQTCFKKPFSAKGFPYKIACMELKV
jgi:hypothetical protein